MGETLYTVIVRINYDWMVYRNLPEAEAVLLVGAFRRPNSPYDVFVYEEPLNDIGLAERGFSGYGIPKPDELPQPGGGEIQCATPEGE